jgi:hypothetical protein
MVVRECVRTAELHLHGGGVGHDALAGGRTLDPDQGTNLQRREQQQPVAAAGRVAPPAIVQQVQEATATAAAAEMQQQPASDTKPAQARTQDSKHIARQ